MRRLLLVLWALSISSSGLFAQLPAACVCAREDKFSDTHASGSCGGGFDCFAATQENLIPALLGQENGDCPGSTGQPCLGQAAMPCTFDQYSVKIASSACAAACMNGDDKAEAVFVSPWGDEEPKEIEPGRFAAFPFAVPNLACGQGPQTITVTVSAGGETVFEVQRRVKCNKCPQDS